MKRIALLVAFVSAIALSLTWNSAPAGARSAGSTKSDSAKRDRSAQLKAEDSVAEYETLRLRAKRFNESREESNSTPGALKRVGRFFKNLFVTGSNKAGNTPGAPQESRATDPDMNSRFGIKIDRWDYLRQREEMIGMLRGLPLPEGVSPDVRSQAIRQMEQQEKQLRKSGQLQPQGSGIWTPIGPAPIPDGQTTNSRNPVSGRVSSIAIHPTNPNIVYVGTAQGGLYRTLDGGLTWTALMDNALTLAIGSVAIDPNTPSTLFVGTGEGGFGGGQFFGVGVYRIKNADTIPVLEGPFNVATNTSTGLMANGRGIPKILVCPTDSNTIFVATSSGGNGLIQSGSAGIGNTQRGVFRSVNAQSASPTFQKLNVNGATGTGTNPGLNTAVQDMEFEPGNPNNLLVGVDDSVGGGTDGVWRSTNALAADNTTVAFTKTLAGACAFCNTQIGISKLLSIVTVYAALETGTGGTVQKSIDGGVTWSPILPTATGFCGGQCFYDMPVSVDPTNPNNVLIGGSGDYDALQTPNKRSIDGTNFVKASDGLHPDTHAIEFAPSNPLIVYHGNDGGIFKSIDGGATWTSANTTSFSATQFVDISTHPTDPFFMIGGTQDNGTPYLQPNNTWKLGDFGDGGYSLIDQNATDTITVTAYHTYFNSAGQQALFVRANNSAEIDPGATGWPTYHGCLSGSSNNGISCADGVLFYAPMAQGPGNPNTIYYGAQHLFRSADRGDTMPAVSQVFAGNLVSAIGISLQTDNARIVGTHLGGLFGTSTAANPMVNLDPTNTVPNVFISRAIFDPNDNIAPYTAYVTLDGFGLAAGAHVWKTTNLADAGTTWTLAGTGIPDVPTNSIVVDPLDPNRLYAGTDIGVYKSLDGGASWNPFSAGMPRVAVFDLEFQARNAANPRTLRAATHGRGIWEITLGPTAAPATISGRITTADGAPLAGVTMRLSGARSGRTITDSQGNYRFSAIDTDNFYMVTPTLVNYHFAPESQSFSLLANKTDAVFTGTRDAVNGGNVIDTADYFVRQHYLDFLGREPDESGFNFWSDQISSCGADAGCRERHTINVSAAYFLSIEFQQTGGLVDGLYRASYGRAPHYAEFMPDTAVVARDVVVGRANWAQTLEGNKQAFVDAWVQRSDFRAAYDGLTTNAYVDELIGNAGAGFNGDRNALVNGLTSGSLTRAAVLRQVVENEGFTRAKRNDMFVMMEYFGYLRRDPDQAGYAFWLNKLNQFDGNFEQAEMVKAFISSGEYRARFQP